MGPRKQSSLRKLSLLLHVMFLKQFMVAIRVLGPCPWVGVPGSPLPPTLPTVPSRASQ